MIIMGLTVYWCRYIFCRLWLNDYHGFDCFFDRNIDIFCLGHIWTPGPGDISACCRRADPQNQASEE